MHIIEFNQRNEFANGLVNKLAISNVDHFFCSFFFFFLNEKKKAAAAVWQLRFFCLFVFCFRQITGISSLIIAVM